MDRGLLQAGDRRGGRHLARVGSGPGLGIHPPGQLGGVLGDDPGRHPVLGEVTDLSRDVVGAGRHGLAGLLHGIELVVDLSQNPRVRAVEAGPLPILRHGEVCQVLELVVPRG